MDVMKSLNGCAWSMNGGWLPTEDKCPLHAHKYYDTWFDKPCEQYNCSNDFKTRMRTISRLVASSNYKDYYDNIGKANRSTNFAQPSCKG